MTSSRLGLAPDLLPRTGTWLLAALAFTNALLYVRAVSWSLIASDNWNHIHPLLADAFAGRLDLGNFLIQRAGVDHAQPLNKLVMWINARWFGLDFRLEGYLGMVFGALALLVLWRMMRSGPTLAGDAADARHIVADSRLQQGRSWSFYLAFAAVAGVLFSLDSPFIYTYSMVTFWYALYFVAWLMLLATWHGLSGGRLWPLAAAAFALGIIGDDSVFLDATALLLALFFFGLRTREWRRVLRAVATIVIAVLLSRLVYAVYGETSGSTQAIFNQPLAARIAGLSSQWRDAWAWFAIPSVSGLMTPQSLRVLAGDGATTIRDAAGAALLLAHAWFWWSAARLRPGAPWLAAVMLMLMFYAHVGAILFARVFVKGTVYMEQARYVSFYQFGIIALLLMAMTCLLQRPSPVARRGIALSAIAIVLLQIGLGIASWRLVPGIQSHNRQMAMSMAQVAIDPQHPPADCASGMDLCVLPLARRIELLALLRDHRLSLFSPQYVQRHPEHADAARMATSAAR